MKLHFEPAIKRLDLLAPPVSHAIQNWTGSTSIGDILVAEIDPKYMSGVALCEHMILIRPMVPIVLLLKLYVAQKKLWQPV